MKNAKILIVDDETIMLNALADTLSTVGYSIFTSNNPKKAIKILETNNIDILITDLKMPEMDGISLIHESKKINPSIIIIVMTAFGTIQSVIDAFKAGAFDYIEKPFSFDKIQLSIERALKTSQIIKENISLKRKLSIEKDIEIIGKSKAIKKVIELVKKVAELNITVLITGESGTGKEITANTIYKLSPRNKLPYIKVNCAALPETLLESELFGHLKGSFTGAIQDKKGRFELANNGTIFLDEIGEISKNVQVKLLRVLQEKTIEPLGSEKSKKIDVRIIAATNKNLTEEVKKGNFREDLYYRLNVINIHLPPLRERKEDIPLLADHFIKKYSNEFNKKILKLTNKAMKKLIEYNWPGNIRELENTLQRAIVFCENEIITDNDIPIEYNLINDYITTNDSLEEVEKKHIEYILKRENWNISKSAKILGIDRKTLYNKLEKYKLKK